MDSPKQTKPPDQHSEDSSETDSLNIVIPIVEYLYESFERKVQRKRKATTAHGSQPKVQKRSTEASNVKIRQIGDCALMPLEHFPGNQLPTKAEILERIFFLQK